MLFEKNMKLEEVIYHDYNLVPVISRFGILLGFGDISIENICKERNINLDFFLTILNSFHDSQYSNNKYLKSFSASVLTNYLSKTHDYYLNNKIPDIEHLIKMMTECNEINNESYHLLDKFFKEYKTELVKHIEREENDVYPYVIDLEDAITNKVVSQKLISKIEDSPVSTYLEDHDNVEEKLTDLKNILIKYLPASTTAKPVQQNRYKLIKELFVLEKDLNDHAKIEDQILVPNVELMEQQVKQIAADNE